MDQLGHTVCPTHEEQTAPIWRPTYDIFFLQICARYNLVRSAAKGDELDRLVGSRYGGNLSTVRRHVEVCIPEVRAHANASKLGSATLHGVESCHNYLTLVGRRFPNRANICRQPAAGNGAPEAHAKNQ